MTKYLFLNPLQTILLINHVLTNSILNFKLGYYDNDDKSQDLLIKLLLVNITQLKHLKRL